MKSIKRVLLGALLALGAVTGFAQVRGVSLTLSPSVSYMWWNENIALANSPFVGGRVGFGFGPFFELRGTFEKSLNLKNALEGKSWNPLTADQLKKLDGMDIDVTRFGGEMKVNLLNGYVLAPYITLGGGVQILDYNPFGVSLPNVVSTARQKEQQLYLSGGVGLKVNFTDRVALTLEGKNIQFNMDANNSFMNPTINQDTKRWGNWSALASLDFYLGGSTKERTQYSDLYNDGFRGMKFVLEPGILYTDFKDSMLRPDQWFMGGSVGVDFSSLVGLRAFYYQATKDPQKLNFEFNSNLRMYGANFITRLNYPRGVVPYLQFGAGYLDDDNFIVPGSGSSFKTHNLFALFGGGVELPISRYVALFGTGNVMLMTDKGTKLAAVNSPTDITANTTFTAGVRVNLGKPAYITSPANALTEEEVAIVNETVAPEAKEEQTTRSTLFGEETRKRATCEKECPRHDSRVMTKQEFEDMVDRILEKIRKEEATKASSFSQSEMDVIVAALRTQNPELVANQEVARSNDELVREISRLVDKLDAQPAQQPTTIYTQPTYAHPNAGGQVVAPIQRVDPVAVQNGDATVAHNQFMKLNRLGLLTGPNFGEGFQWQLGIRGYLQISNTNLDFVPELMVGFGEKTGFDLSANVIYNIPVNLGNFTPYAGLGLGIFSHGKGASFLANVILGTTYKLGKSGELFADYSVRGLFRNNQVAVGYRFVF